MTRSDKIKKIRADKLKLKATFVEKTLSMVIEITFLMFGIKLFNNKAIL